MFLSPKQIAEVLKIVDKYTATHLATTVGVDVLTPMDKQILVGAGFDLKKLSSLKNLNVEQAFKFGLLSDALGDAGVSQMNYAAFKKHLESGRFIPLNTLEQGALNSLKYQAASEVKRKAAGIKSDIEGALVRIDKDGRAIHSKTVVTAAEQAIRDRKSAGQLATEIGKLTGKWNKDLGKVADYIMHETFNEGRIASIRRKNSKVYFDVYAGACKHCVKAYLKGPVGSEPKVFEINDLVANGTNIGKKVADYLPTISGIHPFCRCTASEVPDGYEWNQETRRFERPKVFKRKVNRKSKVKVTVNGKTTII